MDQNKHTTAHFASIYEDGERDVSVSALLEGTNRLAQQVEARRCLMAGYSIATGVIEGACRRSVTDRMGRRGMRWTLEGDRSNVQRANRVPKRYLGRVLRATNPES